jgi:hypothetical protein
VVEFCTDRFLLAAGVYGVRLGVTRKKHVVDAIDSGLKVTFRESGVAMRGTYYQPGRWSVAAVKGGVSLGQETADSRPGGQP